MRFISFSLKYFLAMLFVLPTLAYSQPNEKLFVGYFQSWSERWDSLLPQTPTCANVVLLSFMKPEAIYHAGSFDVQETGLQFPYDGKRLKEIIQSFRQSHPQTKLLVAVGGATYTNWDKVNVADIAALVRDYQLDGVDIDYEPAGNCSKGGDQHIHCQSDQLFIQLVTDFRRAFPRPLLLTAAGWSIGAYGEDQWQNAKPQAERTGMMLAVLRTVGDQLDMINIMSYDAGNKTSTGYDPVEALAAYQHYYHGKLTLGVEIPPEAWGGNILTITELERLLQAVNNQHAAGIMLWSLQKQPNGTPSPQNPDVKLMMEKVCA